MAAGWVAALKLVPWGDVIEATPQILQAARKLLGTTQKGNADAAAGALESAGGEPAIPVALQLQHLRDRVARLEQEQQESAVLIQSLAEQNAQVVQAVEVLRQRHRRLTVAMGVLAAGCAGLLVWALRQ
ncbi:hypothetical protein GmRootA79_11500 [Acidovorax sp. A79]|uniref:hypothetical protein n=1 Tax=unclassified Acidovorax TaxID=2684926 RepID=UPI001C48E090|nr:MULTISPECIES: hypothetical protein [unclassified Acidovorax]MBV7427651.1 hypothetical protein [Acidovorax sp. sif0732]MBV7450011.1 hypothetical protein [Acidovorax sp. sif0715]